MRSERSSVVHEGRERTKLLRCACSREVSSATSIKRAALSRCLGLEGWGVGRNSGAQVNANALENFIPGEKGFLTVDAHAFVPLRCLAVKSPTKVWHER